MPKIKTVKSASKRITSITKNNKVMRLKMGAQHLARRKSKRARQNAMNPMSIKKSDVKKIRRLVPYL